MESHTENSGRDSIIRVLLTGGSGFIGTYLARRLSKKHNVEIMDLIKPSARASYVRHDMRRPFTIDRDVEVVIHLASIVGGIQYFTGHPAIHAHDNSMILANTFEACRKARVERVIYTSSSVVYQYAKTFPTPEEETSRIPPPSSSYGMTKLLGESFCKSYHEEYGLDYTIIRPFNIYGPGEYPDPEYAHAIPQLTRKVLSGQVPIEIYGSGRQTRCFTYAEDVAEAFERCLKSPSAKNETFNVSSDEEVTILQLLQLIWQLTGHRVPLRVFRAPPLPDDVKRRHPSTKKIRRLLGWKPRTPLGEGLSKTVVWLRNTKEDDGLLRTN